jgi:molybdenum cofactor cytidylyltransferase
VIAAVLLAAGSARRFDGSQKLLAEVPHESGRVSLVRRSAMALFEADVERILVVLGRDAETVRRSLDGLFLEFAQNAMFASGMSSSLHVGVREAVRRWPDTRWLLIALGDQPLVGTGVIERIVTAVRVVSERDPKSQIVAPRFRGVLGNPVVFAISLVPRLLAVTGDRGARSIVESNTSQVQYVDFDFPAPLDVDTVADLEALREIRHKV